jgi:hypothetical protein
MQPTGRKGGVSRDTATHDSPPQGDRKTTQKQFWRNASWSPTVMLGSECPERKLFSLTRELRPQGRWTSGTDHEAKAPGASRFKGQW